MRTDPSYPLMFVLPMPPKSSSYFGMTLDERRGHHGHDVVVGGAEARGTEG
jgi:hypothetical protein